MTRVFVDGSAGTTGLRIRERLTARTDVTVTVLPEELRKDEGARKEALRAADIAFLCLPDAAAVEAAAWAGDTVVIDTSTAHRCADGWVYGMPELTGRREQIRKAQRIANPGCHASGMIALVSPLTEAGLIAKDTALTCFSLTGYTGGGKKMIEEYEGEGRNSLLDAPRMYGIGKVHKHLPEMIMQCALETAPAFCPVVGDFPVGMEVVVPLAKGMARGTAEEIREVYRAKYAEGVIRYREQADEAGFLSAGKLANTDSMEVSVYADESKILLVSRFDNLGKGASGAALQNMNIRIGAKETEGLVLAE